MVALTQTFKNEAQRPLIINLELSTARFRLHPGEELLLRYDSDERVDERGSPLRIDIIPGHEGFELVVWTYASEMFRPDGTPAPTDYDLP